MKLCSACLLWLDCRYDGGNKAHPRVLELAKRETLVPFCPEQMAGLPTPRPAAELRDGRVITQDGEDLTERFREGATQALRLAELCRAKTAILKSKSPSCGSGRVYDGTFSGTTIAWDGITAQLFREHGIAVMSEDDIL